ALGGEATAQGYSGKSSAGSRKGPWKTGSLARTFELGTSSTKPVGRRLPPRPWSQRLRWPPRLPTSLLQGRASGRPHVRKCRREPEWTARRRAGDWQDREA